ncbi:hypothetical protein BYT27DRAFT_7257873 [Phlegmacium glaucopus]|nr:hypothetical protein BYT27DRAFT_7257873 [Phlegmacium glaucopus]
MSLHYDTSLLALAPQATNTQLQAEIANHHPNAVERKEAVLPPTKKLPFHHTRKGIIIIVVLATIFIAVVVGGAVGGTRAKHSGGSRSTQATASATANATIVMNGAAPTGATTTGATQGAHPDPTGSAVPTALPEG